MLLQPILDASIEEGIDAKVLQLLFPDTIPTICTHRPSYTALIKQFKYRRYEKRLHTLIDRKENGLVASFPKGQNFDFWLNLTLPQDALRNGYNVFIKDYQQDPYEIYFGTNEFLRSNTIMSGDWDNPHTIFKYA